MTPSSSAPVRAGLGVSAPVEDDASLAAAARRDTAAFAPLYERYVGAIYRYCYVRLGDQHAAEDATSEVFLKAVDGLREFRGGHFAAWLFRIARNVVTDRYRRRRAVQPIEAAVAVADPAPSPEAAVEARWDLEALRTVLATLDEPKRAAVELRGAGWSWEQIADALGKSVDATRMLRARALVELRSALDEAERPASTPNSERASDREGRS